MQINSRRDPRRSASAAYSLCWKDEHGQTRSMDVWSTDRSASGIRIIGPHPLESGTVVYLEARGQGLSGDCVVRHCTREGVNYSIGLELSETARAMADERRGPETNYYEFLQISPMAELPAIQRVYRILAGRFHPDNPETGDIEKFLILQDAHDTLCDAARRAAYDASLRLAETTMSPIFELSEFVIGLEGEANRRLGILSLLYNHRRVAPQNPGIALFDLEKRMGMPREHLEFTVWYLKAKQYVTVGDHSELALTATGVDYLEANANTIPVLRKLLQSGAYSAKSPSTPASPDLPGAAAALEAGGEAGTRSCE